MSRSLPAPAFVLGAIHGKGDAHAGKDHLGFGPAIPGASPRGLLRQPVRIALVVFTHVTAIKGQHGVHLVKFLYGRGLRSQDRSYAPAFTGLRKAAQTPIRSKLRTLRRCSAPRAASSGALVAFMTPHPTGGRPDRCTAAGRLHHGHLC